MVPSARTASTALAARRARAFHSRVFEPFIKTVPMADRSERVLVGGKHLFPLLPRAFDGIKQIGVLGWGSQGPAQAQNLRDSLRGSSIAVKVGLRANSHSRRDARACGFHEDTNTLGSMEDVAAESDMVLLLISDAACVATYKETLARLKPGATLGLSHGYLLGHLDSINQAFPPSMNVVLVAPKGMGPSVRRLYEQADGAAGINASVAIHQDVNGRAVDHALGWSAALGSPFTFSTTLRSEYKSDIYGERGVLLGGVYGLIEALFRHYEHGGHSPEASFEFAAESLTGPLNELISHQGIRAVHDAFHGAEREAFEEAYAAAYHPAREVLEEIYDEVACGNEIRSVNMAVARHERGFPMQATLNDRWMWQLGESVRATRKKRAAPVALHPTTAGTYVAMMMAQIDVLLDHDHSYSEVANESVIEATDSLTPYMHARGVAYMVDNCSITARLGTRKWAPRFDYTITEQALSGKVVSESYKKKMIEAFKTHKIHDVLDTCLTLRPPHDIAVV